MHVEFTAFADDSLIGGSLDCEGDRLSDFLAADSEFEIRDVVVVALNDGRTLWLNDATVSKADFVAITSNGPRGNAALRTRTRAFPVRTRLGPFEIAGYLHLPPGPQPFTGEVRKSVVPLTSATIQYDVGSQRVERSCDALLLNGDRVVWLDAATNRDLGIGDVLDVPTRFARPKDMTSGAM
jgi:hypothetical protein